MKKLDEAADPGRVANFNDLEKEGLIYRFEYTHELAWNVMKEYLEYESTTSIMGSRDNR
ncbi:nucleotidyltransferase substrate binding protein [Dyadobacter psychrotolerans]|uniref:nucleotidyltransferase substrate binding protein n=1 Tax=Dyadobacter psychrotolerans TaxID=2541721 RepID=UPI001E37B645|nr:nucleotidyltransferase substrate binding protein [Dyadobacter psychrotolerans]